VLTLAHYSSQSSANSIFSPSTHKLIDLRSSTTSSIFSLRENIILNLRGGDDSNETKTPTQNLKGLIEETINENRKIIVVTGGILSGIGKGVIASSMGVILRAMGLRVTALKIDPYLNVDAGTMSPFEHGEVFVLDDGGETDLDLGNYERFLSVSLTKESNMSTGKVYQVSLEYQASIVILCSFFTVKE
jgi:hypothetical protein